MSKEEKINKKICNEYFRNKLGKFYKGVVSIISLGEIFKAIMDKELQENEFSIEFSKQSVFQDLLLLLKDENIDFWFPQIKALKISTELIEKFRLEPADSLHLVCAYEDNDCGTFITLDNKLINNDYLEKRLNIKIKSPKQL